MPGKSKNVDWRFRCYLNGRGRWINLEVKRRDGDIKGLCPRGANVVDPFAKIADKFSPSADDEINVAAITVFGSAPDEVIAEAQDWLANAKNKNVDCVIVWNEATSTVASTALKEKADKLAALQSFLDAPTPAGEVPIIIRHPIEVPGLPMTVQ